MERTKVTATKIKEVTGDNVITWRKIGRGSLRFKGRIIKPGENFKASPSELSASLRRFLIPLGDVVEKTIEPVKPDKKVEPSEYKIIPRGKGFAWFDVVNTQIVTDEFPQGKVLNEKSLTKAKAEQFVANLTAK